LALCSDGTVAAWGDNEFGQLGDNTLANRYAPVAVNTAAPRFTRVASGPAAYHTLALVAGSPASTITLAGARRLADGSFQFTFSNTPGAVFSVLGTANSALPFSDWTSLGAATEVSPGQFQFTDPQAPANQRRFYRVHSQ
jgi:hypothetical protein